MPTLLQRLMFVLNNDLYWSIQEVIFKLIFHKSTHNARHNSIFFWLQMCNYRLIILAQKMLITNNVIASKSMHITPLTINSCIFNHSVIPRHATLRTVNHMHKLGWRRVFYFSGQPEIEIY